MQREVNEETSSLLCATVAMATGFLRCQCRKKVRFWFMFTYITIENLIKKFKVNTGLWSLKLLTKTWFHRCTFVENFFVNNAKCSNKWDLIRSCFEDLQWSPDNSQLLSTTVLYNIVVPDLFCTSTGLLYDNFFTGKKYGIFFIVLRLWHESSEKDVE